MTLPAPLAPLALYPQWICYHLRPGAKPGKLDKIPCDPRTGRMFPSESGGAMNPAHHVDYETARAAAARCDIGHGSGVGFVFLPTDPFWFVDADNAWDGTAWSPTALAVDTLLAGAACEVSQSGLGLHWIGSGIPPTHGCKNIPLGLELYHEFRFVALTGNARADGNVMTDLSAVLPTLVDRYFPPSTASAPGMGWTTEPAADWDTRLADDAELLRCAHAARSAASTFGAAPTAKGEPTAKGGPGGQATVTFTELWEGNADAIAARWPGNTQGYDASQADAALATHLAFWTGRDCERIERLMRESALVRDKWDRTSGYLEPTILKAVATSSGYAKARAPQPAPAAATVDPEASVAAATGVPFGTFIPPAAFPDFFPNCAYVHSIKAVYTPVGPLESTGFDTEYGGKRFILDGEGSKTTASAWEAFRLCQLWRPPIADTICFRPESPPLTILKSEGRRLLNIYQPVDTLRHAGDPSRFIDLLKRLLPIERDRDILLTYVAALVQNPGRKFQWWPVLQGAEGNGKTLIASCVAHAVGHRYTHMVNPEAMAKTGNQFNKWVQGNLFVVLEEIYMAHRRDFLEAFKSTVTNARIGVEGKGSDQVTGDNRVNGMMFTNHPDGVPVTVDTRRYCILFTAQQRAEDIERDFPPGYFPDLYDWMHGRGDYAYLGPDYGFGVVNDYMRNYQPVAEFNPAGLCQRAPTTSSTQAAREWSLGRAEQEVREAIDEGRPGFANGWVSSGALDTMLEALRIPVPRNKRRDLMRSLGYDWHPALGAEGRTNNPVAPDGRKVRLYVKHMHLALNLEHPIAVAEAYTRAQSAAGNEATTARFGVAPTG